MHTRKGSFATTLAFALEIKKLKVDSVNKMLISRGIRTWTNAFDGACHADFKSGVHVQGESSALRPQRLHVTLLGLF